MDKILLTGLQFRGFHGVLPEEQVLGQPFIIDLELLGRFSLAAAEDNLELAVNYAKVYEATKRIVEERRYKLIETLAEKIADTILNEFVSLQQVVVRVNKPHAPIAGIFGNVAVEIMRGR